MRVSRKSVCVLMAIAGAAGTAHAQTDVTFNNAGGGVWSDSGNWSPATVPNNNGPTFNAILTALGGAYTVDLDIPVTIENFTMDDSLASLDVGTRTLTVNQGFTADVGTIFSSGGGGLITVAGETVFGDVVLMGAGQLQASGSMTIAPPTLMDICDTDVDYGGTGGQAALWEGNNTMSLNMGGTFNNGSQSLLEVSPDGDKQVGGDGTGTLTNDGEMVMLASPPPVRAGLVKVAQAIGVSPRGGAAQINDTLRFDSSSFVNNGGVTVLLGELDLLEVVNDMTVDGELLLGRWTLRTAVGAGPSTISFPPRDAVDVINTQVSLFGESTFFPAINGVSRVGFAGVFEIGQGRDFLVQQSMFNLGEIVVGSGSVFDTQSGLANITAADQVLAGGAYTVFGTFLSPSIAPVLELHKSRVRLIGPGSQFPTLDFVEVIGTEAMLSIEGGRSFTTLNDLRLKPTGTLRVSMGSLVSIDGVLLNDNNGALTGGTFEIAGSLIGGIGPIGSLIGSRLALSGSGSQVIDGAGQDVLASLAYVGPAATLEVLAGKQFVTDQSFLVDGTLVVDPSSAINPLTGGVMAGGTSLETLATLEINTGSVVEIGVRSGSAGGTGLVRADSVTFEGGGAGKLVCRFGIGIEEPAYPLSVHVVRSGAVAGQFATVEAIGLDPLFVMSVEYDALGVQIVIGWACPPDMNNDGILDNGDIGDFVDLFLAGDIRADFNGDGILDNGDISEFIDQFIAGC